MFWILKNVNKKKNNLQSFIVNDFDPAPCNNDYFLLKKRYDYVSFTTGTYINGDMSDALYNGLLYPGFNYENLLLSD